jgi:hypothetical protein
MTKKILTYTEFVEKIEAIAENPPDHYCGYILCEVCPFNATLEEVIDAENKVCGAQGQAYRRAKIYSTQEKLQHLFGQRPDA